MGACASFPKILGGKAPVPEKLSEETTEAVVVTDKAVEEVKIEETPKEAIEEVKKETDEVATTSSAVESVVEEVKAVPGPSVDKPAATVEEPKKE